MILETKDLQIEYTLSGVENQNTLIILPGANNTPRTYRNTLKQLSKNFRVYCIYYPGFGKTTPPKEHSLEDYRQYLNIFIENLNLRDSLLCGFSFGAIVVTDYLNNTTNHLNKKCFLASPMIKLRSYNFLTLYWGLLREDIAGLWIGKKSIAPKSIDPAFIHNPVEQIKHVRMILSFKDTDKMFESINFSTFILSGKIDRVVDSSVTKQIADANRNIKLEMNEDYGHNTFGLIGDDLDRMISDFGFMPSSS